MVQHELLMVVAAPLIALGAPLVGDSLGDARAASRRRLIESVRRTPGDRRLAVADLAGVRRSSSTASRCGSGTYRRSTTTRWSTRRIHIVQHLCFFGTAALFWWGIAHGRYGRAGYGAAVVYVFATAVHGGVLGALLTVSPRVWYAPYVAHHPAGLTPLEDQQLAGLLMWVPAGLIVRRRRAVPVRGVAAAVGSAVALQGRRRAEAHTNHDERLHIRPRASLSCS